MRIDNAYQGGIDDGRRTLLRGLGALGVLGATGTASARTNRSAGSRASDRVYFDGLEHRSVGGATLERTDEDHLVVGNLGEDGEAGVRALPGSAGGVAPGLRLQPGQTSAGAYKEVRLTGVVDGEAGQPIGQVRLTRTDDAGAYAIEPDFSPLGAESYSLEVRNDGEPVYEGEGFTGQTAIQTPDGYEGDFGVALFPWFRLIWLIIELIEAIEDLIEEFTVVAPDGNESEGDEVRFDYGGGTVEDVSVTSAEVVAGGVDEVRLVSNGPVAFGRVHHQAGDARLAARQGGEALTVAPQTAGGVGVDLDYATAFDASLDAVEFGTDGATLHQRAAGTVEGTDEEAPLGSTTLTWDGSVLGASANFEAVGSTAALVEVYESGEKVGEAEVEAAGGTVAEVQEQAAVMGTGVRTSQPGYVTRFAEPVPIVTADGSLFGGDELRVLAGAPDGEVTAATGYFCETTEIPPFDILDEIPP